LRNEARVKHLEDKVIVQNHGLRVIMPLDGLYSDNQESYLYWTDQPVGGMEILYGDGYRRVEHPHGKIPTIKAM